ncbi:uncharacterized protein [Epargyreus clarus]|uniref:uncharacterized protein n=1 Tax=Epargyreus clarus TaxID=520877 RepID=UPI003C2B8B54
MIDYTAKTLSIYESIYNSYNSQAIAVRDKHIDDFGQFRYWFQHRPEHLKHVLEDVAENRLYIEPNVKKLALVIDEYSHLEENFIKRSDKTNSLLKKLERYMIICKHNCEIKHLGGTDTNDSQDEYICSSLEDLHRDITSKLKLFEKEMRTNMQQQVSDDDKVFGEKIDILKNKLKDLALNQFGRTMYDILNLQDEYHHFIKDITRINPMDYLRDFKHKILIIDTQLFEFENLIEEYGNYCRSCRANDLLSLLQNAAVFSKHKESKNKNMLDDLLHEKFTEIETAINEDYERIFHELNSLIDNTDTEDVFLNDLQPIQNDVIEMLQMERDNFNELKKIAPRSSVTKLIKLAESTEKLLSIINEEMHNLKPNDDKHGAAGAVSGVRGGGCGGVSVQGACTVWPRQGHGGAAAAPLRRPAPRPLPPSYVGDTTRP